MFIDSIQTTLGQLRNITDGCIAVKWQSATEQVADRELSTKELFEHQMVVTGLNERVWI